MVNIHFIRWGKKDLECNFLETTQEQRNELSKMVNGCVDFNEEVEINIVKLGLLKDEMCRDKRIRKSIMYKISILGKGKALLPNELKKKYSEKKICYYCYEHDFNEAIMTVFHELYHFNDPFGFKECVQKKEKEGGNLSLKGNLKYNIKAELSEFFAEYKVAKNLSNQSRFKDVLMKRANLFFYFLEGSVRNSNIINKEFEKFSPSVELMDMIFNSKFEKLFRIIGIWRGLKKIDVSLVLKKWWNDLNQMTTNENYLLLDFFKYLKKKLLKELIKSLEKRLFRKFKKYFRTQYNFQF